MVALLRGVIRRRIESTGALVGILALPLSPMGWIHAVGKFPIVCLFAYDLFVLLGGLWRLTLQLIFISASAMCRISQNRSLLRCPHVISLNPCTTNGINSLATKVVICILLLSMISFGHSCKLSGITNI